MSAPLTPDLTEDVAVLRRTASSIHQIEQWFQQHAGLLQQIPEHLLSRVKVEIDVHNNRYDYLVEKNAVWMSVQFSVQREPAEKTPLESVFRLRTDGDKSLQWHFYHMPLNFKEWPLCTAWLAYHYCMDEPNREYYGVKAEHKLSEFLPLHFPNLSLQTLRDLHAGGLLPMEEYLFVETLFASNRDQPVIAQQLPDGLQPT